MICSHYEVFAYDSKWNMLATLIVYSFDEAYYNIDKLRKKLKKRCNYGEIKNV